MSTAPAEIRFLKPTFAVTAGPLGLCVVVAAQPALPLKPRPTSTLNRAA